MATSQSYQTNQRGAVQVEYLGSILHTKVQWWAGGWSILPARQARCTSLYIQDQPYSKLTQRSIMLTIGLSKSSVKMVYIDTFWITLDHPIQALSYGPFCGCLHPVCGSQNAPSPNATRFSTVSVQLQLCLSVNSCIYNYACFCMEIVYSPFLKWKTRRSNNVRVGSCLRLLRTSYRYSAWVPYCETTALASMLMVRWFEW